MWKFHRPKPVIGLSGGIGSGKSTVGRLFGRLGCLVIDSDALSHEAIQLPEVKTKIREWLGGEVFGGDGSVNRRAVARRVFANSRDTERLNGLIHPKVHEKRDELMGRGFSDPSIRAVVWDTPLLFETGLEKECDAVVFVKVPLEVRLKRLAQGRGWGPEEVAKREKLQFSLDKKAELADYCIDNSGDEASTLRQVQRILSQILALPV
jgi:dephospho-CoA kinase